MISGAAHRFLFLAAILVAGVYCAAAASKTWPIIDGDGPAYFPAAVEWSLGHPLTNPVWLPPLDDSIDGPGGRRFTYHGFVYARVVGGMAHLIGGGAEATVAVAYLFHWLAAVAAAFAVRAWLPHDSRVRWLTPLLPLTMLAVSVSTHGRVESMAVLVVSMVVLAWRCAWPPVREMFAGAGVALLTFTSPACGVVGACALAAALAHTDRRTGARVAAAVVGGAVAAGVVIWSYPYPIADWITGVVRHSRINVALPPGQGFVTTWVRAAELPLLIVTVGVVAGSAAIYARALAPSLMHTRRIVFTLAVLAFAAGLTRVAFVKTEAFYNAVVWLPLLGALAVATRARMAGAVALGVALVLPVVGLVRSSVVLAHQFRTGAVTFAEVRDVMTALPGGEFSVTGGLWLAVDLPASAVFTTRDRPERRFFVLQQVNTGQTTPPAIDGYAVRLDRFGRGARVLGIPVSRTGGGWNFAVYEQAGE